MSNQDEINVVMFLQNRLGHTLDTRESGIAHCYLEVVGNNRIRIKGGVDGIKRFIMINQGRAVFNRDIRNVK